MAKEGHTEVIRLLLNRGAGINLTTAEGNAPLHLASEQGHLPVVQLLMNSGPDINLPNKRGDTALHMACAQNHHEVATLLHKNGGDIQCKNAAGKRPTDLALNKKIKQLGKKTRQKERLADWGTRNNSTGNR